MMGEEIHQSSFEVKEPESEKMKCFKKIEYDVPDVGKVVEELNVELTKIIKDKPKEETVALHKVFINGDLVREVDFINNKVLKSESRFEPWSFLHIDQSTFQQMRDNAIAFQS
ncbi:uncharacterized protein LOC113790357 [Dermatophagoides pteronyssinus]|uniref:Uncharacterized protein LOC113790357 n=2 Tax=Dermatophagoides pteronyssinus TaxID=6956 RepID=A0A6P6XQQ2_DERPT|nr:uncharacterized protein LOC113790357 [Dermatophagoides pteronyssinus]